jgi:poly [ADP-ribose] polymerase
MSEPEPQLPPYVIEGARSSRSRCKTCRRKIDKGSLRVGMLIEGPFGTGYLWHHIRCAARRHFERLTEAYELQAWNEAKEPPSKVPELDTLENLRHEAEEKRSKRKEIPYVELAPSGRSRCKRCEETIEKDAPRVVLGRTIEFGQQVRTAPVNVHPRCVREEMNNPECATEPDGFADAVRANSRDMPAERIEAALAEVGDLS